MGGCQGGGGGGWGVLSLWRGVVLGARAGTCAASEALVSVEQSPPPDTDYGSTADWRIDDGTRAEVKRIMWDKVGMARNEAGLKEALQRIPQIRSEFWENVNVLGSGDELNISLEYAGRVADFLEFAELLTYDALMREESCGGHFREEYQTEDGEAQRNDDKFAYAAAWEFQGVDQYPKLHEEPLVYSEIKLAQRSYK